MALTLGLIPVGIRTSHLRRTRYCKANLLRILNIKCIFLVRSSLFCDSDRTITSVPHLLNHLSILFFVMSWFTITAVAF